MRLLLLEDDEKLSGFIVKGFQQAGFAVDHCSNGHDALHLALTETYDAAVMDIMVPGIDGFAIIEKIRSHGIRTPVIILSAKRSVDDRIKGLQIGSDDYLIKPFSFSELLARVQALIRRASAAVEPTSLTLGDVSIDLVTRRVERAGRELDLQPKEFALLEYLMRNPGKVLSKTIIMEHIWDYSFDPQTNVVDVLVCRLRAKLDRDFDAKMLHTIRGVGYVLRED